MTHYAIVGMGVAGITAAETLRQLDASAEISLIGDEPQGFYSRPGLAYSLSGEIPERMLSLYSEKDWKALNIHHIQGHACRLDPQAHHVEITNHGVLAYDRLLLATGAAAVPLQVPGASLHGVVKLDLFEDSHKILSLARHAKTAVVVGGGIVAAELVEGLLEQKLKVHYLLRGDRFWANILDENESRLVEKRLVHDGVILHYRTEISQILGRGGKVSAVETNQGQVLPCGLVAVGIGVRPRLELAYSAGLKTDRGILTNEYLQTSNADIYAAGDVAQAFDLSNRRALIDNLWHPAREQGKLAARNMAGQQTPYRRPVAINVLRLARVMVSIIGAVGSGRDEDLVSVARGSSETWLQMPNTLAMESGNELSHVRLMVGEHTLLGALVMGDQGISLPLQEIISLQMDITPIRDRLLQPGAALGQEVMDFWTASHAEGKDNETQQ